MDYGKGPSKEDWAKHSEIQNTGFEGWDVFKRLPVILKMEIPWMRGYTLSFSSPDDMGDFTSRGWRPLRADHFGTQGLKTFNESIGLRFNLESLDGTVKFKNHYVMIKPQDLRNEQMRRQNEAFESYFEKFTHQKYAHPKDPRAAEMMEASSAMLDAKRYTRKPTKKEDKGEAEDE